LRVDRAVHIAEHLRVTRQRGVRGCRCLRHRVIPFGGEPARIGGPDGRRAPPRHRLTKRSETNLRIGDKRQGAVLYGIVSRDIQLDQPKFRIAKQSARRGREIRQPGADREYRVGFRGERIGGAAASDANRADCAGMIPSERALPGLRLGDR
jgi:hypothetical protein